MCNGGVGRLEGDSFILLNYLKGILIGFIRRNLLVVGGFSIISEF